MKKISSLVLCLGLFFGVVSPATTSASKADALKPDLEFGAVITNENGEVLDYEIKDVKRTSSKAETIGTYDNSSGNKEITETYEVTVVLPSSEISPMDSAGGEKEENSVKASMTVTYDWRQKANSPTRKEIKINNFSGKWEPGQFIIVSNRYASMNDGESFPGNKIEKNPTSNTFSYNTGWGYVEWYPDTQVSGPRGNTEATLTVAGMGGTANIFLFVVVR
ncbi:hypothetical protein SAMN05661091_4124 [Paenibacillus uliginis N3/975]|uniref:Uncharacterized protein n=1 Tax=Paenibacillus uliginis N3/975 TaxID=1313296 RepID=A0A1X7HKT9_9BACL|nr:hypothetical protein [Paenibacillus uliginis]SMF88116.1 hypothetical protein SAMN05661091_4124 [Paenibacillus uliginis N3/975]